MYFSPGNIESRFAGNGDISHGIPTIRRFERPERLVNPALKLARARFGNSAKVGKLRPSPWLYKSTKNKKRGEPNEEKQRQRKRRVGRGRRRGQVS